MIKMEFNWIQTLTFLVAFLIIGYGIKKRVPVFSKYYIPAPLIGGLVFALIIMLISKSYTIKFTYSFLPVFVAGFFASIGMRFDLTTILKKGIKSQMLYFVITIIIAFFQNIVAVLIGKVFGRSFAESLVVGSISLMGDHTLVKTAPNYLKAGKAYLPQIQGISILTLYIATIVGVVLFYKMKSKVDMSKTVKIPAPSLSPMEFLKYMFLFLICITLGLLPTQLGIGNYINPAGGGFLAGVFVRQFIDGTKISKVEVPPVNILGNFCLSMLLVTNFAMFNLTLIKNVSVFSLVVLLIQFIILILFVYYVVFRMYKKDVLALYASVGLIGFSLGMPASTMSSIQVFTEKDGAVPLALFTVPPVGAWLITVVNPFIINLFL